jgi:hypothetical protein
VAERATGARWTPISRRVPDFSISPTCCARVPDFVGDGIMLAGVTEAIVSQMA